MNTEFWEIDGLIPARGGSQRIKNKNMRLLTGKPLIYWTIRAAMASKIFRRIVVSTDDQYTKEYCSKFVDVIDRPPEFATDTSPDVEWIKHYLENNKSADHFMILRPTSPFRTPQSIIRAWEAYKNDGYADSLRAITPVKQHPGKMWRTVEGAQRINPLMNWYGVGLQASYNSPTQSLPKIYVQSACIEICEARQVLFRNNVSGQQIMPFFTDGLESLDLNTPEDWILAEHYIKEGIVKL